MYFVIRVNRSGMNGTACVLKTLCEVGRKSHEKEPGSFLAEIIRIVFRWELSMYTAVIQLLGPFNCLVILSSYPQIPDGSTEYLSGQYGRGLFKFNVILFEYSNIEIYICQCYSDPTVYRQPSWSNRYISDTLNTMMLIKIQSIAPKRTPSVRRVCGAHGLWWKQWPILID